MNRRTWVFMAFTVVLVAWLPNHGVTVYSQGTAKATMNGDIDGNSRIDITDAVGLLNFLFIGGPPPAAIEVGGSSLPPAPPLGIHCARSDKGIQLTWENPAPYDEIEIFRNGKSLTVLAAREAAFMDPNYLQGETIEYAIRGKVENVVSAPSSCSVEIPPPPVLGNCLVASGQQTCIGSGFAEMDCSLPPAKGQDGFYQRGCPMEGRFTDNGDGTLSDRCTGLIWTKDAVDVNQDFEVTEADSKIWSDAVKVAENLDFAGHDDWRLPNVEEIFSIINFASIERVGFYPDFTGFVGIVGDRSFWSSTTIYYQSAFVTGTYAGQCYNGCSQVGNTIWPLPKSDKAYILAVREAR